MRPREFHARRFCCACVAVALVALVAPAGVLAQADASSKAPASASPSATPPTAKELFERGRAAYDKGDYQTAVAEWQQAYATDPRPALQYNLAQAYEKLDMLPEAVAAMEAYLKGAPPDHPYQVDARAKIGGMRERLEKTGIQLVGGPEGATILVDGEDWGRLPRRDPIKLTPGTHVVRVEAVGRAPFEVRAAVSAGKTLSVEVQMGAEVSSAPVPGDEADPDEPDTGTGSLLPWILVGGGGALAVTGVVVGTIALGKAEDATSDKSSDADSARGLALGADVLIFGGIGVAAAGVVLLVLDDGADERPAALRVQPWADRTGVGAFASGSF